MTTRRPLLATGLHAAVIALALVAATAGAVRAEPASATKDLLKCQKAIGKEGAKLLAFEQKALEKCYEGLLKCRIMEAKDEHKSPEAALKCFEKAAGKCEKATAKIAKAQDKKGPKLAKKCDKVTITDIQATDGLGYGLLPCGAEDTIAGFLACLDQVLQPKTEIVTGQLAARIGTLLDAEGLGGAFPDLPRPEATP